MDWNSWVTAGVSLFVGIIAITWRFGKLEGRVKGMESQIEELTRRVNDAMNRRR